MNFIKDQLNEIFNNKYILLLHEKLIVTYGGSHGIRDVGLIESSLAQPKMTFDGKELYPTIIEKASILGFCLIKNHCFIDGNKRIGHAAIEMFLLLNGYEIMDDINNQENVILSVASGSMSKKEFTKWLKYKVKKKFQ